jgi:hypothetical protein
MHDFLPFLRRTSGIHAGSRYEPNKGQKLGVIKSGMTIAEAVHIAEVFKFWMLRESVGDAASDKGTQ